MPKVVIEGISSSQDERGCFVRGYFRGTKAGRVGKGKKRRGKKNSGAGIMQKAYTRKH